MTTSKKPRVKTVVLRNGLLAKAGKSTPNVTIREGVNVEKPIVKETAVDFFSMKKKRKTTGSVDKQNKQSDVRKKPSRDWIDKKDCKLGTAVLRTL